MNWPSVANWSISCRSIVASQVVKDLEGLNYFICCKLTQVINQDFYLIVRLRFDEPHDVYVEPEGIRLEKAAHKALEDP